MRRQPRGIDPIRSSQGKRNDCCPTRDRSVAGRDGAAASHRLGRPRSRVRPCFYGTIDFRIPQRGPVERYDGARRGNHLRGVRGRNPHHDLRWVQFQRLLRNSGVLESECPNGTRHHLYPRTVFGRHFVVSVLGLFDRRTRVWPDHHAERPVPSWRSSAGRGHVQGLPRVRNRGIRGMDGNEALIATHSRAPRFRVPGSSQASLERRRDQEPGAWNPEP